jgi:hypothetical protein
VIPPTTADFYQVVEDDAVCQDWTAPHFALMEIYATMTVSLHVPRIKYKHSCDRTKKNAEALTGSDYTTIQQVLNSPRLRSDTSILSIEELKQQCRRCLLSFDPELEAARDKVRGFHHCFVFPEDTGRIGNWDPDSIPFTPHRLPGISPLSTIILPLRQRLYHSALEWQGVTDMPPDEQESGVVFWLDTTTIGLAYPDALAEIPDISNVTSISILASPLCSSANWAYLPTGQVCHEYGEGLKDYIASRLPHLVGKGNNGEHGVTFKIVTSTAAAFSRMILAKTLLCPPRSSTCLLPSASKRHEFNRAVVLEDPGWMKSVDFMGKTFLTTWNILHLLSTFKLTFLFYFFGSKCRSSWHKHRQDLRC